MKTQKTFFQKSGMIRLILGLSLLAVLFSLSGCMSPQERNGVSLLPQNRPASWESSRSIGGGMY